jgi:hypothetical protein
MKAEVRDILGKAAYEATSSSGAPSWEKQDGYLREIFCQQAEAVVKELADLLVPNLITALLTQEDMKEILTSL